VQNMGSSLEKMGAMRRMRSELAMVIMSSFAQHKRKGSYWGMIYMNIMNTFPYFNNDIFTLEWLCFVTPWAMLQRANVIRR
jgi:hypothetical protein